MLCSHILDGSIVGLAPVPSEQSSAILLVGAASQPTISSSVQERGPPRKVCTESS
jgi:hypothetical protein